MNGSSFPGPTAPSGGTCVACLPTLIMPPFRPPESDGAGTATVTASD
jgi:hypothetical protein